MKHYFFIMLFVLITMLTLSCSGMVKHEASFSEKGLPHPAASIPLEVGQVTSDAKDPPLSIEAQIPDGHSSNKVEIPPLLMTKEPIVTIKVISKSLDSDTQTITPQVSPIFSSEVPMNSLGTIFFLNEDGILYLNLDNPSDHELLVKHDPDHRIIRVATAPDQSRVAYWVNTVEGIELWISELHNWNPILLFSETINEVPSTGTLRWMNNHFMILQVVTPNDNSVSSVIGGWVIDSRGNDVVFQTRSHEINWSCSIRENVDRHVMQVMCPLFDWTDLGESESVFIMSGEEYKISNEVTSEANFAYQKFAWSLDEHYVANLLPSGSTLLIWEGTQTSETHKASNHFGVSSFQWSANYHIAYDIFDHEVCLGSCISILFYKDRRWSFVELPLELKSKDVSSYYWRESGDLLAVYEQDEQRMFAFDPEENTLTELIDGINLQQIVGWIDMVQ